MIKEGDKYELKAPGYPRVTLIVEDIETAGRQMKIGGRIEASMDPAWPIGMYMETGFIYKPGYEGW